MIAKLFDLLAAPIDFAVLQAQQVGVDRAVLALSHEQRLARLAEVEAPYMDASLLDFPGGFLDIPGPIEPVLTPVGAGVTDLSWVSTSHPWNTELVEKYLSHIENRTVHARWFHSADPDAPTVILIHGYGAGHFAFESRAWPVAALRRKGWNVVLATLPFHARRASPGRSISPPFPGADPRVTNEGFRQAIHDLLGLRVWLGTRSRGPIGAWGISLGGYTTALLATVDAQLAFAAMVIPLGSAADYARKHGRLGAGHDADALHAGIERVNAVISPYARPSKLAPGRVAVLAARADRVTGPEQAGRLARHFGVEVELIGGGHIVNAGLFAGYRGLVEWTTGLAL